MSSAVIVIILCCSLFVAQYEEYRPSLIDHLVERKIMHWDSSIRLLAAQVSPLLSIY